MVAVSVIIVRNCLWIYITLLNWYTLFKPGVSEPRFFLFLLPFLYFYKAYQWPTCFVWHRTTVMIENRFVCSLTIPRHCRAYHLLLGISNGPFPVCFNSRLLNFKVWRTFISVYKGNSWVYNCTWTYNLHTYLYITPSIGIHEVVSVLFI